MDGRYQDPDVLAMLNKASVLDPRFKSLLTFHHILNKRQ